MTKHGFWVEQDLQDDRKLDGMKLTAGLLSVIGLVAMFVTSLFRAPETAWSVALVVIAVALTVVIARGVARGRRRGRFRSSAQR